MSFESKTVEPERSPIDSPCQNVEKGSSHSEHARPGGVQRRAVSGCTEQVDMK